MPFESLIKKELARLLPQRYAVTSGYLSDREGNTAGHCDLIAFNSVWFSPVKSAEEKGQEYLPVEGVYAVGEVKQTKMMIVGELQDGLVFDSAYQEVTGTALTRHIIPMFAGQRRHRLIFLTKSTQVQHALELPPTLQVSFLMVGKCRRRWDKMGAWDALTLPTL